jgi:hypothetical protein
MNLQHTRARRILGFAAAAVLAAVGVGVGVAAPASAATANLTINGTVVNSSSTPVANQAVTVSTNVHSYNAVTDATGRFSVAVEYDTNMAYVSVYAGLANAYIDPSTLGGATETSITLTLPDVVTVTIEGNVADAYGTPLAGTLVSASSEAGGADATTDAAGHYSVTLQALLGRNIFMFTQDHGSLVVVTGYSAGAVIHQDITVGKGNVHTVEIDGVYLGVDGKPIASGEVYIASDQAFVLVTTNADGSFTATITYSEFGQINLSAAYASLDLDPATLIGKTNVSVVLRDLPIAHFTIQGTVYDLAGNTVANQLVAAYGEATTYTRSDAVGHYSLPAVGNPVSQIDLSVEDGDDYAISGYSEGSLVTQDVVVTGSGSQIWISGPSIQCDVDGDGLVDEVSSHTVLTTGKVGWSFTLAADPFGVHEATFGQGTISAVYCADLNGDGASELIAQGAHDKVKKATGNTVTKNDWWIYDFATDTATQRTFPNGVISGVTFANLDATPGVEMIVERLRDSGPNTFWVLDTPTAPIEKFSVGFGTGGTLAFTNYDGVAGTDIVATKVKPNGTTVTEYYTRASGHGEVVKVKVKSK